MKRLQSETVSNGLVKNLALPTGDLSKQGTSCNESVHGAFEREIDNQGGNNGLRWKEANIQTCIYGHNSALRFPLLERGHLGVALSCALCASCWSPTHPTQCSHVAICMTRHPQSRSSCKSPCAVRELT